MKHTSGSGESSDLKECNASKRRQERSETENKKKVVDLNPNISVITLKYK